MIVGVSGAGGRMGTLVAETILATGDLELGPLYDPEHAGDTFGGVTIQSSAETGSEGEPGCECLFQRLDCLY